MGLHGKKIGYVPDRTGQRKEICSLCGDSYFTGTKRETGHGWGNCTCRKCGGHNLSILKCEDCGEDHIDDKDFGVIPKEKMISLTDIERLANEIVPVWRDGFRRLDEAFDKLDSTISGLNKGEAKKE